MNDYDGDTPPRFDEKKGNHTRIALDLIALIPCCLVRKGFEEFQVDLGVSSKHGFKRLGDFSWEN
jgi:hypothetical protein